MRFPGRAPCREGWAPGLAVWLRRFLLAAVVLAGPAAVPAAEFDQGPVFTLLEENDLIVSTDRHYTQGIKLSYLQRDGEMPCWVEHLNDVVPALGFSNCVQKFGYEIGQNIYTPANLQTVMLLTNDRPYAGWLHGGLVLQRRGWTAGWLTLESFQFEFGVIGPPSLADKAQTWVHQIRGFDLPQGWHNQISTEPGLNLKYERAVRLSLEGPEPRYFDFIPHAGASLGNVETNFRLGTTARLGWNLPENFGVQTISSLVTTEGGASRSRQGSRWSLYIFTTIEGWVVAHSVFLDGNLFRESPNVEKQTLVAEWKSGFCFGTPWFEGGFTYVYRSPEFVGQQKDAGYGSVFLKVRF